MPLAGEVLGALWGVENFMITDVISPVLFASTEATQPANPEVRAVPSDYATALISVSRQLQSRAIK